MTYSQTLGFILYWNLWPNHEILFIFDIKINFHNSDNEDEDCDDGRFSSGHETQRESDDEKFVHICWSLYAHMMQWLS